MGRPKGSLNKTRQPNIELECDFCRKIFSVRLWRITQGNKRGKPVRFCSMACQHKGTIDKRVRYGEQTGQWKDGRSSYRQRAFREKGEICELCGYKKYKILLWIHHKNFIGRKNQIDHNIENLEVLCIRCHLERHYEAGKDIRYHVVQE